MSKPRQRFIDWQHVGKTRSSINYRTRKANSERNKKRRWLGLAERPHENISSEELARAFILSGGKCAWCDQPTNANHFDHIYPTSKEGQNTAGNIAFTCPTCNRRKAGKHPAQFACEIFKRTGIKTDLLWQIELHYGISLMVQRSLWLPAEIIYTNTNTQKRRAA